MITPSSGRAHCTRPQSRACAKGIESVRRPGAERDDEHVREAGELAGVAY